MKPSKFYFVKKQIRIRT